MHVFEPAEPIVSGWLVDRATPLKLITSRNRNAGNLSRGATGTALTPRVTIAIDPVAPVAALENVVMVRVLAEPRERHQERVITAVAAFVVARAACGAPVSDSADNQIRLCQIRAGTEVTRGMWLRSACRHTLTPFLYQFHKTSSIGIAAVYAMHEAAVKNAAEWQSCRHRSLPRLRRNRCSHWTAPDCSGSVRFLEPPLALNLRRRIVTKCRH